MQIGLGISVTNALRSSGAAAPSSDPNITAFNANGWTVEYTSPPTFDPVGDPKVAYVTRSGFNASGGATTVTDTVTIMKRLRQAYANHASLTANTSVLADYIYSTDVITGFTNSSTRVAPKPIAMWLNRDLERATTSSHVVRLAVAHAHGRSGKPVAAVKFTAFDGTTTVETIVSAMTSVQYSASGYYVPCFEGTLDFSTLTQGVAITIDAVIYPWVGAAFTVSTDADTYPSPNLTTLRVLNDRTGAYGTAYACVDPVSGVDGTGVTSATRATAVASPYLTLAAAAAAVKTFNNANYGRNNSDGGYVLLKVGTTTLGASISSTASTTTWPLTIEAENAANIATTIFADRGTTLAGGCPSKLVVRNLTVKRGATGSITFLDNGAGSLSYTNLMSIENCIFDAGGFGTYSAWIYKTGVGYYINCSGGTCGQAGITGVVNKTVKAIGCTGTMVSSDINYGMLGCYNTYTALAASSIPATAAKPENTGLFVGWSLISCTTNGQAAVGSSRVVGSRGAVFVGSVVEQTAGTTAPVWAFNADSNVLATENILEFSNTVVGSRTNVQYQDTGVVTIAKSGYTRFSVHTLYNSKTDVFATNANCIGNWPVAFHVGNRSNAFLYGSSDPSSTFGTGKWLGELGALGEVSGSAGTPLTANWTSDKSFTGTGAGKGDYRPQSGHQLPLIPAGLSMYPVDFLGQTIATDGTAVVGALQAA